MKRIKGLLISERISVDPKSFSKYPEGVQEIAQTIMMTNSEIKLPLNIISSYHFLAPYESKFLLEFFCWI